LRETASYEPSCVKISSVVFPVEDSKKKAKGREGTKSHKRYISRIRGEAPVNGFSPNFAHQDVIICVNFSVEKLRGLGNTRGKILEFPIEMAGHPYNSAALPHSL